MIESFITLVYVSMNLYNGKGITEIPGVVTIPTSKISRIFDVSKECAVETQMATFYLKGSCDSTILKRLNVK